MFESILSQAPADGRTLFLDMNSFFASVEQQARPELRDRPVGVCPFISNATCVIAASVEAKRWGVKTGTNVAAAKQLCPQIELVEAHPRLYRRYHSRIMAALDQTRCQVTVKSIDEALLTVPRDLRPDVKSVAREAKDRISRIGGRLTCSIGIASNLFLAKVASNVKKPNGLVEVKLSNVEGLYSVLRLTDLHGISWRMARRLKAIGIATPLDFYHAPYPLLKRTFGVNGEAWYLRLRGYEVDTKPTIRRMIGHQTTIVPHPATTRAEVLSVAAQLTYRAATRLRAAGLSARGVVVYVRFSDRSSWQQVYRHGRAFFDSAAFFGHVRRLLAGCPLDRPVRLVSVSAIELSDTKSSSIGLFDDACKPERLSRALDKINFRYGEGAAVTGRQLLAGKPRDAIGFANAKDYPHELPLADGSG